MNKMHKAILVAAILLVQCLAIGWLIYRYERVVTKGTVIRLKCTAYDPYDPFRGRFLRATVREEVPVANELTDIGDYYRIRNNFYARIEPAADGTGLSKVVEIALEPTDQGLWVKPQHTSMHQGHNDMIRQENESWDDFHKRREQEGLYAFVEFPNQLFLNEKIAPNAEKLLTQQIGQAVAVYRALNHDVVLVDIEIDGQSIRELVKKSE